MDQPMRAALSFQRPNGTIVSVQVAPNFEMRDVGESL
jgi:hypothetical protein